MATEKRNNTMKINAEELADAVTETVTKPKENFQVTWDYLLLSILKVAQIAIRVTDVIRQDEELTIEFPKKKTRDLKLEKEVLDIMKQFKA